VVSQALEKCPTAIDVLITIKEHSRQRTMQSISYYLAYPFIYILASVPFPVLYLISDVLARLMTVIGYRKEVIQENLRNSFPEKSPADIRKLTDSYYRYLCDLIMEIFKTMKMTRSEHVKRVKLMNPEVLEDLYQQHKSIIFMLGHHGNWEWFGPCISLQTRYTLVVVYRPLSHPYYERMMSSWRTKFNTEITPVLQTIRTMVANRNRVTATAFIADQAAPGDAYWTTFLHQDTSVYTGAERLAVKFNYPVVYLHATRPKRGYYILTPEVLYPEPSKTAENEIVEGFTRRLEKDIIQEPEIWLWSHKRWKNKRPPAKQ